MKVSAKKLHASNATIDGSLEGKVTIRLRAFTYLRATYLIRCLRIHSKSRLVENDVVKSINFRS